MLGGLDALHHHQAARLVDQRHETGQDASHARRAHGFHDHRTIELHDVRFEPPNALEIRLARAEIVDRDQAAEISEILHAARQVLFVVGRGLQDLDHHAMGGYPVALEHARQDGARGVALQDQRGADVQEDPIIGGALQHAILQCSARQI